MLDAPPDHWLPGFNFNVEEWFEGDRYETLAICRTLELTRAAFQIASCVMRFTNGGNNGGSQRCRHYGTPITLDQAKKVMAAAEAKALQNNWYVAISIMDSGGNPVMLHRLDGTQLASIRIAEGKALTAVEFRRPTKAMEDVIAHGGAGLRYFTVPNVNFMEGGIPIIVDGKIIGGIGVSGVGSKDDAQIAQAGADAIK